MHSLLDVAKVADSLVFVLDSTEGWDTYGDHCLSCLFAQGLPSHGWFPFFVQYVENLTLFSWFLSSEILFLLNLSLHPSSPCSSGVSGFVWHLSEEEGRFQKSSVKDHRSPLPGQPPLPFGLGSRHHPPPQAPGKPEATKAGLPLQTLPSFGWARGVHAKWPSGREWWRRRRAQRPGDPARVRVRPRSCPPRQQTGAHQRARGLSAESDRRSAGPSAPQPDHSQSDKTWKGKRCWDAGKR